MTIDHKFEGNLHKTIFKDLVSGAKNANEVWLAEDIKIICPSPLGATLIYDIDYTIASIIEITFTGAAGGAAGYSPIENGDQIKGLQSRFLRVLNGDLINFRAQTAGSLKRIVVGEV